MQNSHPAPGATVDGRFQHALHSADWPLLARLCQRALRKNPRDLPAGVGPGHCELQLHFGARRGHDAGIGAFPIDQVGHRMGRAPAADGEIARAQCAVDSRYASGHAIAPPAGSVRRSAGTIGRSILIVAIHATQDAH
ncbi:hypothetical protein ET532_008845 [Verminephrobacter sp. Larva24]|nr:hypothetical protein ET532_008845 [Verminephrobacter sp. Larva24]